MTKVTIIAVGRVRSVGYRALVRQAASQFGLKGLVREISNGQVEVFCEGKPSSISKFLKIINYKGQQNSALSLYVESLTVNCEGEKGYLGPLKEYKEFEIDYGFEVNSPFDRELLECLESRLLHLAPR